MVFFMMQLNYYLIKINLFYSKQNIHNVTRRVYSVCQSDNGGYRTNRFPICSDCLTNIFRYYQGHKLYFSSSISMELNTMHSFNKVKN
jgi:hypothetical protein